MGGTDLTLGGGGGFKRGRGATLLKREEEVWSVSKGKSGLWLGGWVGPSLLSECLLDCYVISFLLPPVTFMHRGCNEMYHMRCIWYTLGGHASGHRVFEWGVRVTDTWGAMHRATTSNMVMDIPWCQRCTCI